MTPRPFRTVRRLTRRAGRTRVKTLVAVAAVLGVIGGGAVVLEQVDVDRAPACALEPPKGDPEVVTRVIDGDTLELADGRQVRLYCIDTPETQKRQRRTPWCANYDAGKAATEAVKPLVLGQAVTFGRSEDDSSGRDMAAQVYLPSGVELGEWLVNNGHAVPRPDLTDAGRKLPDPAIEAACPPGVAGGQKASR